MCSLLNLNWTVRLIKTHSFIIYLNCILEPIKGILFLTIAQMRYVIYSWFYLSLRPCLWLFSKGKNSLLNLTARITWENCQECLWNTRYIDTVHTQALFLKASLLLKLYTRERYILLYGGVFMEWNRAPTQEMSGVIIKGCLPSVGVSALLQQMKMDAARFAFCRPLSFHRPFFFIYLNHIIFPPPSPLSSLGSLSTSFPSHIRREGFCVQRQRPRSVRSL